MIPADSLSFLYAVDMAAVQHHVVPVKNIEPVFHFAAALIRIRQIAPTPAMSERFQDARQANVLYPADLAHKLKPAISSAEGHFQIQFYALALMDCRGNLVQDVLREHVLMMDALRIQAAPALKQTAGAMQTAVMQQHATIINAKRDGGQAAHIAIKPNFARVHRLIPHVIAPLYFGTRVIHISNIKIKK